jgi:hypothetical protein
MRRPRSTAAAATAAWPDPAWTLLVAAALAAPVMVLGQGGDWQAAVVASLACLAAPGAAIEAMLGLGRLLARVEGGS